MARFPAVCVGRAGKRTKRSARREKHVIHGRYKVCPICKANDGVGKYLGDYGSHTSTQRHVRARNKVLHDFG